MHHDRANGATSHDRSGSRAGHHRPSTATAGHDRAASPAGHHRANCAVANHDRASRDGHDGGRARRATVGASTSTERTSEAGTGPPTTRRLPGTSSTPVYSSTLSCADNV